MGWLRGTVVAYGVVNILGGVMGLVMGKSVFSLVVGGAAGAILIACGLIAKGKPAAGFRGAGLVATLLLGFWAYRITEVLGQDKSPLLPILNLALAAVVLGTLLAAHLRATTRPAG